MNCTQSSGNSFIKLPDKDSPGAQGLDLALNPGAPGLALPLEQVFVNPPCGFHPFDFLLASHSGGPCIMHLRPDKSPRPILGRELVTRRHRIIMLRDTAAEIVGLPDIERAGALFKNVNPELAGYRSQAPRQGLEPWT